jgi:hypothetical protein
MAQQMQLIIEKHLGYLLTIGTLANDLPNIVWSTRAITERFYKKEVPVDKGLARNSVRSKQDERYGYITTTTAKRAGRSYPVFVHEGTYDFKGVDQDYGGGGRSGAVRSLNSARRGGFSYVDGGHGSKGIRPNKFATRAKAQAQPLVIQQIEKDIIKLAMR